MRTPCAPLHAFALTAALGLAACANPTAAPPTGEAPAPASPTRAAVSPVPPPSPTAAATVTPVQRAAPPTEPPASPEPTAAPSLYLGIPHGHTEEGFPYLGAADAPVTLIDYSDFL